MPSPEALRVPATPFDIPEKCRASTARFSPQLRSQRPAGMDAVERKKRNHVAIGGEDFSASLFKARRLFATLIGGTPSRSLSCLGESYAMAETAAKVIPPAVLTARAGYRGRVSPNLNTHDHGCWLAPTSLQFPRTNQPLTGLALFLNASMNKLQ